MSSEIYNDPASNSPIHQTVYCHVSCCHKLSIQLALILVQRSTHASICAWQFYPLY